MRKAERSVSSKVTSSLACIHGQVTKHTTVKWPIQCHEYFSLHGYFSVTQFSQRENKSNGVTENLALSQQINYIRCLPSHIITKIDNFCKHYGSPDYE